MTPSIIDNVTSPKGQLDWLRVLMIPALLNSLVMFPAVLLMAILGSGTALAIVGSFPAVLAVLVHTAVIGFAVIIWDRASLFSAILMCLYILGNVAVVILLRSTEPLMATLPWYEIGLSGDSTLGAILQIIVSVTLALIVPAMSAWRLFRHAFDMDVIDHSSPVELWDLKSINK